MVHDNARCLFTKRDEVEHMVLSDDDEEEDLGDLPDNTIDLSPWVIEVGVCTICTSVTLTDRMLTDCLDGLSEATARDCNAAVQKTRVCSFQLTMLQTLIAQQI